MLIYLYNFSDARVNVENTPSLGDSLYLLPFQDIFAVISKVSEDNFGSESLAEHLQELTWVARQTRVHHQVVECLMSQAAILPLKFPSLLDSEAHVLKFMEVHYTLIQESLSFLKAKEEWNLRIFNSANSDNSWTKAPEFHFIKPDLQDSSPSKAYFQEKQKAQMARQEVQAQIHDAVEDCFFHLKARSSGAIRTPSQNTPGSNFSLPMSLNAVFLVEQHSREFFLHQFKSLKNKYQSLDLQFQLLGPGANYHFIDEQLAAHLIF